jgi:GntR family transcriptional regulator
MDILISNSSDKPIYLQIVNQIKRHISSGNLIEGEPLPSIRNLAKELEISVITTKRAYDELENDGFINTIPGKGSYVASINTELLQENKKSIVEGKICEAILLAKSIGLSLKDLIKIMSILYEE